MKHIFIREIPRDLVQGTLYISTEFALAIHLCACGCQTETVTPLSRKAGWQLVFDGTTVSLFPSIKNRSLSCRSHYFVVNDEVVWLRDRDRHEDGHQTETYDVAERDPATRSPRRKDPSSEARDDAVLLAQWFALRLIDG